MSVLRKILFNACLMSVALFAAGDRSVAQDVDWTTVYAGTQAGYSWTDTTFSGIPLVGTLDLDEFNGGLIGVHAGWTPYQQNDVVIGLVSDIYWSAASESKSETSSVTTITPVPDAPSVTTVRQTTTKAELDLRWKASLRAKAGTLINPNTLLFATAGVAFASIGFQFDAATTTTTNPGGTTSSTSFGSFDEILTGFVVGGGIETMIAPGISAFAQALHYEFDDDVDIAGATISVDMREVAVMTGISFHLN